MEIITGDAIELRKMIDSAYRKSRKCRSSISKFAMADYISQLHDLHNLMTGSNDELDQLRCLGSYRKTKKYYEYIDSLFDRLDENFVRYKKFHNEMFGQIIDIHDEGLSKFWGSEYSSGSTDMTKEEFFEYFFEFLKQYKLENMFDRFISNKRIFNRPFSSEEKFYGSCLQEPFGSDTLISFCDFHYSLPYLITLAHEFGHVYDLAKLKGDALPKKSMNYYYTSAYGEVVSMMFEKLFYDYLFDKKYRIKQVRDLSIDYHFANRQNVMAMYILTLLSDEMIWNDPGEIDRNIMLQRVSPFFESDEEISWFIGVRDFDTWKDQVYSYGEVISTILKENVKKEGLNSQLMASFMNGRCNSFHPDFMLNNGFVPESYQKVYSKDISRL